MLFRPVKMLSLDTLRQPANTAKPSFQCGSNFNHHFIFSLLQAGAQIIPIDRDHLDSKGYAVAENLHALRRIRNLQDSPLGSPSRKTCAVSLPAKHSSTG